MNIWIVQSCKFYYLFLPLVQYKPYVGECLKVHVADLQKRMTRRQSQSRRTRWFNEAIYHVLQLMLELFFCDGSMGERRRIEEILHMNRDLLFKGIDVLREQIYI